MSSGLFDQFFHELLKGNIDLDSHTIKIALMGAGYSFDRTVDGWSAISANEIAEGNGYTAGGMTLANCLITSPVNDSYFSCDDPQWDNSTITAYSAVIYDDSHASKALIASVDFGGAKTSNNGTFKVNFVGNILRVAFYTGLLPGEQMD